MVLFIFVHPATPGAIVAADAPAARVSEFLQKDLLVVVMIFEYSYGSFGQK
jgi:hypothetical protein